MNYFILSVFVFFAFCLVGLEEREYPIQMKTSIIIPCCQQHLYLLPELIEHYRNQTAFPDEIIIALDECQDDSAAQAIINEIISCENAFEIKIVFDAGGNPGSARNAACESSKGDILICQDADDIPHPQRTEIIKNYFEKHEIDLLIHQWIRSDDLFFYILLEQQSQITSTSTIFDKICSHYILNGNVAITKEVFKEIKWPHKHIGEDIFFNIQVFNNFENKMFLDLPLMMYRNELSSHKIKTMAKSQK